MTGLDNGDVIGFGRRPKRLEARVCGKLWVSDLAQGKEPADVDALG